MSYFIDRMMYFAQDRQPFSGKHGVTTGENRGWEDAYRGRWAHDQIVRSTHGVNCTGSCSWKICVKNGLITWERSRRITRARAPIFPTMSRAAVAWCQLQLVYLCGEPAEISADPTTAYRVVAGGKGPA